MPCRTIVLLPALFLSTSAAAQGRTPQVTSPAPATATASTADPLHASARALFDRFARAWSRADAASLAELFSPDADLVIPTGLEIQGRSAIRQFYAGVFERGYAGSTGGGAIHAVRGIAPGVAVVDATWFIRGAREREGGSAGDRVRPAEEGILAAVLVERDHVWVIAALREQAGAQSFSAFGAAPRDAGAPR